MSLPNFGSILERNEKSRYICEKQPEANHDTWVPQVNEPAFIE